MECGILLPQKKPIKMFDHLEEKKAEGEDNENISSRGSGYAEADLVGISSTSEYVWSAEGKVSMESSKEKPDFTSPNVSFTSTEMERFFQKKDKFF